MAGVSGAGARAGAGGASGGASGAGGASGSAGGGNGGTAGAGGAATLVEMVDLEDVFSGHPVNFALVTRENRQFAAYYDAQRNMTVASRTLGSTTWTVHALADGARLGQPQLRRDGARLGESASTCRATCTTCR